MKTVREIQADIEKLKKLSCNLEKLQQFFEGNTDNQVRAYELANEITEETDLNSPLFIVIRAAQGVVENEITRIQKTLNTIEVEI